jgi:hypothetical protein
LTLSDERVEVVDFLAEGEAQPKRPPEVNSENGLLAQLQVGGPSGSGSARSALRKVRVRAHVTCREDLRLLALSLWGKYDQVNNNYVDFRDNISAPFSHRRTPLVDAADFESLILIANRSPRFLMLSPLEITQRKAQGITINKEGYVSLYSINIGFFKSFASQLENAITGVEALKGNSQASLLHKCPFQNIENLEIVNLGDSTNLRLQLTFEQAQIQAKPF